MAEEHERFRGEDLRERVSVRGVGLVESIDEQNEPLPIASDSDSRRVQR